MVFKKLFKILKRTFRRSLRIKIRHRHKKKKIRRKRAGQRPRRKAKPRVRKRKRSGTRMRKRGVIKRKVTKRKKSKKISSRRKINRLKKPLPQKKVEKAQCIGDITHYFPNVKAAVVQLKNKIRIGDAVWIKGTTTDFRQTVGSLQINRKPIEKAGRGQEIGLEVLKEVRVGDKIYRSAQ